MQAAPAIQQIGHASLICYRVWGGNHAACTALSVPGIDAWVCCSPCGGAPSGGDLYYTSVCGCGEISRFALADVSGHVPTVAAVAQRLSRLMFKHIYSLDQREFAPALNRDFAAMGDDGRFATALLMSYYPPTDHLVVCNAGHPPPLWYRAHAGTWEVRDGDLPQVEEEPANLPLGVLGPTRYAQFAVRLAKGDLVVICSDGIIEANGEGQMVGHSRLLALARDTPVAEPETCADRLLAGTDAWLGDRPGEDDRTLMVLHHNAADPPRRSLLSRYKNPAKLSCCAE